MLTYQCQWLFGDSLILFLTYKTPHVNMIFLPLQYNKKVLYLQKTIALLGEGNGTPLEYSCLENPMDGEVWWAAVHGVAKSWTWLSDSTFSFHFHALEKEMTTHSSVLAWRIPGMGEPGGLPSLGLHRVGHDWSNLAAAAAEHRTGDWINTSTYKWFYETKI